MKKILIVAGLIIFAGIKTSFSFIWFEGSDRVVYPEMSVKDAILTGRATLIIDAAPDADFSDLISFGNAVESQDWPTVFELADDALSALGNITPENITPGAESIIGDIVKSQDLISKTKEHALKDKIITQATADTITQIITRAQQLQAQLPKPENPEVQTAEKPVSEMGYEELKEVVGENLEGNPELAYQGLSVLRKKSDNKELALKQKQNLVKFLVNNFKDIESLIEAIRTQDQELGMWVSGMIKGIQSNRDGAEYIKDPQTGSEIADSAIIAANAETTSTEIATVQGRRIGAVTDNIRNGINPDAISEGKRDEVAEASAAKIKKGDAPTEVVTAYMAEVGAILAHKLLVEGTPGQIVAALRTLTEQGTIADETIFSSDDYKDIADQMQPRSGEVDGSPAQKQATAIRAAGMLAGNITAGNKTKGETLAGRLTDDGIVPVLSVIARQYASLSPEDKTVFIEAVAGGIFQMQDTALAAAAAENLGRLSNNLNPAERKEFTHDFTKTVAVIGTGNTAAIVSAFAAGLDTAGREMLADIAAANPVISSALGNAGVSVIQSKPDSNQSTQPMHMGTLGSAAGLTESPVSSEYSMIDEQKEKGYTTIYTNMPSATNPSIYNSSTDIVAAVPVVATLSLDGPVVVPEVSIHAIVYDTINGKAVTPQELIQAIQSGRMAGIDKKVLASVLESLGTGSIKENIDISLTGLKLSDYASTLMFENSISNFIQLLYNDLKGAGSLKNININSEDYIDFASPQAIIKEILKRLKQDKKITEQRAKLKLVFPKKVPLTAFMIIFLSMVIFAIVLGRSIAKYYLDTAVEKESGCF